MGGLTEAACRARTAELSPGPQHAHRLASAVRPLVAAVLVGIAAGVAGAGLTLVLHLVQHLAFGYTENSFLIGVETASSWRRVAAMTLGGLVVGVGWWQLRRRLDIEGVSVTRAMRDHEPRLPLVAALMDAVLQIVAVGVGGSLGREGAPRQAGAALAETLARCWRLSPQLRRTLVACGAGAGLAAVYNVPVAGALFALELLLVSRRPHDIALVAVSSGVATVVAWPALSTKATYDIGATPFQWSVLALAVVLGPVAGVLGVGFIRLTTAARTHARAGALTVLTIPASFAVVGALGIAYPQLLGNGKGQAQLAFTAALPLVLAGTLVVLKPLATSVCLAGGAIGGLLTPSLASGAALGAFTGLLCQHLAPSISVAGAAVVGAAALLAVTQRAPVMAVAITLELIGGGLALTLPMIVAVVLGIGTAAGLDPGLRPTWWDAATRMRTRSDRPRGLGQAIGPPSAPGQAGDAPRQGAPRH